MRPRGHRDGAWTVPPDTYLVGSTVCQALELFRARVPRMFGFQAVVPIRRIADNGPDSAATKIARPHWTRGVM
jgi:hypothetical protein